MTRTMLTALLLMPFLVVGSVAYGESSTSETRLTEKGLKRSTITPNDVDPVYAPLRYAIVIGVNRPADTSLHPLRFAERDAAQLAAVLKDPAIGGFDKVISLPAGSRQEVLNALEEARQVLHPNDLFLLYFSGHGTASIDQSLKTSLFLMARDSYLPRLAKTAVSVRDIQEKLSRMATRRKVLIIDACYNGDGKSGISEETRARKQQLKGAGSTDLKEPPRESEAHLFAAAIGQPAMEDSQLGSGVYTWFLLQALQKPQLADSNHDGAVSVAEAHSYSRDQTMNRTGYRQVPWASYRIVGREDIYLAGRSRTGVEQALVYTFNERYDGARVYANGKSKGVLPRAIELEPGTWDLLIQAPDGTRLFSHSVVLKADESLRVDDLEAQLDRSRKEARRKTWLGLGVAAGLGTAAAITGVQTLSLATLYQSASFNNAEDAALVKARGEKYRLATNLLLGGTVTSALVSGYFAVAPSRFTFKPLGLETRVTPDVGLDGAHLKVSVRF